MPWPTPSDYFEAVQNLRSSVQDEELRAGEPALNRLGLPLQWEGGFANVYKAECPASGNTWALKCFTRETPGLSDRFCEIAAHLEQTHLPFTVDFQWIEPGIRVRGTWYPLLKMRWVEGPTLNQFVEHSLGRPERLQKVLDVWPNLVVGLRHASIAHGDLQHGNVILVPRPGRSPELKLVDYDGMHVPTLADTQSGERGHPAYQHPQRTSEGTYSAEVDRFSHLVIYTAIRCLVAAGRPLWKRFNNGENLLFREEDFKDPGASKLFATLWRLDDAECRALAGRLALACRAPLDEVPLLDELITNGEVRPLALGEERAITALLGKRKGRAARRPAEHAVAAAAPREPWWIGGPAPADLTQPPPQRRPVRATAAGGTRRPDHLVGRSVSVRPASARGTPPRPIEPQPKAGHPPRAHHLLKRLATAAALLAVVALLLALQFVGALLVGLPTTPRRPVATSKRPEPPSAHNAPPIAGSAQGPSEAAKRVPIPAPPSPNGFNAEPVASPPAALFRSDPILSTNGFNDEPVASPPAALFRSDPILSTNGFNAEPVASPPATKPAPAPPYGPWTAYRPVPMPERPQGRQPAPPDISRPEPKRSAQMPGSQGEQRWAFRPVIPPQSISLNDQELYRSNMRYYEKRAAAKARRANADAQDRREEGQIHNTKSVFPAAPESPVVTAPLRPVSADDYFSRGLAEARAAQYPWPAINDFSRVITLRPNWAPGYCERGRTYLKLKQKHLAIDDLTEAIRLDPDYEEAYRFRSAAHELLGDSEAADKDLAKAEELRKRRSTHNTPVD